MKHILSLFIIVTLGSSALAQDVRRIVSHAGVPSAGTSEIQTLTIGGTPTAGTFKISFMGFQSGAITWSATNATLLANINTALDAMPNLANGEVVATATSLVAGIGTIALTFSGDSAKLAVDLMVAASSLTGTAPTASIAETTAGVTATHRGTPVGQLVVDETNGKLYINTGTVLVPIWTVVGAQT